MYISPKNDIFVPHQFSKMIFFPVIAVKIFHLFPCIFFLNKSSYFFTNQPITYLVILFCPFNRMIYFFFDLRLYEFGQNFWISFKILFHFMFHYKKVDNSSARHRFYLGIVNGRAWLCVLTSVTLPKLHKIWIFAGEEKFWLWINCQF